MRLAFCGRLAPLPLRCLRFAPRFLAESVRAARSVAAVYRNPNNSVFWQGQASACGNLANAPLFALLCFARAVVPCSRRPSCGLLLVPAPLKRGSHSRPRAPVPRCPRPSPWFLACSGLAGVAGIRARPVSAPRFKGAWAGRPLSLSCSLRSLAKLDWLRSLCSLRSNLANIPRAKRTGMLTL